MKWPTTEYDQCPHAEPAATTEEEAWALKLPEPDKLKETGYIPYFREFARICASQGLPFCLAMYGPWTTAGNIVGVERLCRWIIKQPDLAHPLVRLATDSTASASNDMISPKTFKEFVLPYLIEYHSRLIGLGVPSINFHLCGDQNANYELYPQVPLPPLSIISVSHEVDLEKAMATFPEYIIMGNIEPALLQLGQPEQIYETCRVILEKGKKHKRGFAIAPGCELSPPTPPHNVWTVAKAINDFGYYD